MVYLDWLFAANRAFEATAALHPHFSPGEPMIEVGFFIARSRTPPLLSTRQWLIAPPASRYSARPR